MAMPGLTFIGSLVVIVIPIVIGSYYYMMTNRTERGMKWMATAVLICILYAASSPLVNAPPGVPVAPGAQQDKPIARPAPAPRLSPPPLSTPMPGCLEVEGESRRP